jgi:hypothetical protein
MLQLQFDLSVSAKRLEARSGFEPLNKGFAYLSPISRTLNKTSGVSQQTPPLRASFGPLPFGCVNATGGQSEQRSPIRPLRNVPDEAGETDTNQRQYFQVG